MESRSYDVFLSFRGEDTRHSFTDHLYHKLILAGIYAFRDNEEIKRGEELKPEIESAIRNSRASIVVLSENYATSSWCLEELVLILQQRRVINHFVLPIFYHVDPSDVRKHEGNFAVEKDRWKTALTDVANLSGFTLSGPETKTLKEIVDTIYNRLDQKEVYLPPNITGMASRYEEISSWLDQCNVEFLAIYGMGGSGKTTLAKYIYNLHRRTFEYVSFVENIGSRCETYNDLLELQKQLLKDIIGGKKRKIPGISQGTCMIEEVLQMNRTLIVLDDIVERSQLVALLGTRKINAQSKIIITTRETTYNWFDFPYWRCQMYEMRLLNDDESLELLCRHAFQSEIQHEGYDRVIKYCEGNPLALEVMGSSMSKYNVNTVMPSQLRLLEIDMDSRIQSVLIKSYMSLPSNVVKELFLHIACFFVGMDIDYVVKILEPDYAARSGIETLLEKFLLTILPNKKLMMHRLLQEMAKNIVRQESAKLPAKRSRVWLSSDSYKILSKGKGSNTVEGLALDIKILEKENFAFKSSELKTDALKNMEILKLLQLNFVELSGSYENFSEDIRWLCWIGFNLRTIPLDLYMGNLVAVDMSYSKMEVFEPPMVLQSLQILNLKDSHNLVEVRNIFNIPHLETLILWNCYNLVNVCKSIEGLKSLALLNMTGCKNLFNRGQANLLATSSSGVVNKKPILSFPFSLHRLFLKDCNLECNDSFPLSFSVQPYLQYLNLCNSLFESLPCYNHLENLRVLDLSFCSKLKSLLCLPSTLAELYIYYCESLEKITFQSHRFPLQEFGCKGCVNLYEIEDYIKLVPVAKLDEADLGHMKWLQEYQNHEICLVGDNELTAGRRRHIQMLYEFNIISTSLPDINDPNMRPMFISESSSLSFNVPSRPKNKILKGINVTFKYSISGDDWAWFCKITTTNGVLDLVYNPKVFGKPESGEVCVWFSYWPIGNTIEVGDTVNVSIVVMSGLESHECGVSLVYSDKETLERDTVWTEILGGDFPGFQLSTGAYYLCRRDFFSLMEVGRLSPDWFTVLAGDIIDYTEVRGWGKTGRSQQVISSYTELKTIRCIIHGPQFEDIYDITEMSKSYIGDKTMGFTSSVLEGEMKSGTRSELTDETWEVSNSGHPLHQQQQQQQKGNQIQSISEDNRMIWVGYLQNWMDETYLQSCFPQTAEVASIKLIRDKQTGKSERYGFIEFCSHEAAEKVLQNYNGTMMPNTDQVFQLNWAGTNSIYVGDLAPDVTDALLYETFVGRYPSVKAAKVVLDKNTGCSRGYGFVRFGDENESEHAVNEMNGKYCSSRPMRVCVVTPKFDEREYIDCKNIVLAVKISSGIEKRKMMKNVSKVKGVDSISYDIKQGKLTVTGHVDPVTLVYQVRKVVDATIQGQPLKLTHASKAKPGYIPENKNTSVGPVKLLYPTKAGPDYHLDRNTNVYSYKSYYGYQRLPQNTEPTDCSVM